MVPLPPCPLCASGYTYADAGLLACPECAHEWDAQAVPAPGMVVRDSNGNALAEGDSVVVIKDLKVKGSSISLKQGSLIRNIRLVADDVEHIEGHSEKIRGLVLKTCFLRKA